MQNLSDGLALTHEKVVSIRIWASNLEELHEIVELAVDVATYCDRAFLLQNFSMNDSVAKALISLIPYHWLYIGLVLQHFASLDHFFSAFRTLADLSCI